jgi:peptide/nickel transport system substrate-binding protein/microcin C transport system substrate-binding protein
VELLTFEALADQSADEPATMYGLVANEMLVEPDFSAITFRIDPAAHFNNGDPVTAQDVKYSFDMLTGPLAIPSTAQLFDGVKDAVVLDSRTIRFNLKTPSRDQIFQLGTSLVVFSPKWGAGPDGKPKPFDQIIYDKPIATGAYTVGRNESGNFLELDRDPNYWARDKGVRRGFFNFDHIIYHFFTDNATRFEAFKSGDFDMIKEYGARRWAKQYSGPKFDDGRIIKKALPDRTGFILEGLLLNTRRPIFQDVRVREALNDSFNWEWSGRQAFNLLGRFDGLFQNSPFAASGSPSPEEEKLLEPFRATLPSCVFGPLPKNPRTDTSPMAMRENLLHARDLLASAGWRVAPDGRLRNAAGQSMDFDFLNDDLLWANTIEPWRRNLQKLGIQLTYRVVDPAIYFERLQRFDFDAIMINYPSFLVPPAGQVDDLFGSASADVPASGNLMGIKNPAIDAALAAMKSASTLPELETASHALDRVFVCEHYAVPMNYRAFNDVAYWNKFGIPEKEPQFFSIDEGFGTLPWPLETWWDKSLH